MWYLLSNGISLHDDQVFCGEVGDRANILFLQHFRSIHLYSYGYELEASYSMGYNSFKIILDFDIPVVPDLTLWEPRKATRWVLLICAHYSVNTSLVLGTTRYSRLILDFCTFKFESAVSLRNPAPC